MLCSGEKQIGHMFNQKHKQEKCKNIIKLAVESYRECCQTSMMAGFLPSTFCYCHFSFEIELIMQLGVWGRCELWLKLHLDLLKPLEMALFFGCDKFYSYCITTTPAKTYC